MPVTSSQEISSYLLKSSQTNDLNTFDIALIHIYSTYTTFCGDSCFLNDLIVLRVRNVRHRVLLQLESRADVSSIAIATGIIIGVGLQPAARYFEQQPYSRRRARFELCWTDADERYWQRDAAATAGSKSNAKHQRHGQG